MLRWNQETELTEAVARLESWSHSKGRHLSLSGLCLSLPKPPAEPLLAGLVTGLRATLEPTG